jgi:hypothetical protein
LLATEQRATAEFRITKIPDYTRARSPFPTSPSLSFFLSSHTVWSTALKSEILTGTTENRFCARYTVCVFSMQSGRVAPLCVCMHTLYLYTCTRLFPIIYILCGVRPALAHPSFSLFIWYERRKRISVHPRLGFCCLRSLTSPPNPPPNCALALSLCHCILHGESELVLIHAGTQKMHLAIVSCELWRVSIFFYISGQMLLFVNFAGVSKRLFTFCWLFTFHSHRFSWSTNFVFGYIGRFRVTVLLWPS